MPPFPHRGYSPVDTTQFLPVDMRYPNITQGDLRLARKFFLEFPRPEMPTHVQFFVAVGLLVLISLVQIQ